MKPHLFDIVFTNESAIYCSGQILQGHAMLELSESMKVTGIRISCRGKAFVHWTDQHMRGPGESRYKAVRHHSATEEYIDISQSLLSKESMQRGDKKVLEAGQYTYPFQFTIPHVSPCSFEGQYGFIRYWIKFIIERPWKENICVKKLFTVISPLDLNHDSNAKSPIGSSGEKRLCCLCCVSGPLCSSLHLSHKGYVPGEVVHINAEIKNSTRRKIGSTSVELLMTSTFRTPTKTRTVTQQVAKILHGSISAGGTDMWESERMVLPSLPPSFLVGCGIIDVRYTLELRAYPVGPAFELSVPLEIVVGTVPLASTLERYSNASQPPPANSRNFGASADVGVGAWNIIMPSYSPSAMCHFHVHDDEDDHHTIIDANYVPRFIHFDFASLPMKRQHTVRFAT